MGPNTDITTKGIIVIQSLKDDDRKTGEELNEEILKYKKYVHVDSFVKFYNVISKSEFIKIFGLIKKELRDGEIFTLHLETHGSETGIHLASGEIVLWKEFFDCIRPINEAMCNLLVIVMSMCKGGALISYIEPEKRAPYKAFIGAFRDMGEDELARGFAAFYNDYTDMLDIVKGMGALKNEIDGPKSPVSTFWCYTSEKIFDMTFNPNNDSIHFQKMVTERMKQLKSMGKKPKRKTVAYQIHRLLSETASKYRDYYCFKDILHAKE